MRKPVHNLCAFAFFSVLSFYAFSSEKGIHYTLATGTVGGTFYAAGLAIGALIDSTNACEETIAFTSVDTAGSLDNIARLRSGKAEFAILQRVAAQTESESNPEELDQTSAGRLRSIALLWRNVEHFIIRSKFAKTGTIADMGELKGRKVYLGTTASGTLESNRAILRSLGLEINEDFSLELGTYAEAVTALESGEIDGVSVPGGEPVSAVKRALLTLGNEISLLEVTKDQLIAIRKEYPFWERYIISLSAYEGLSNEIATISQPVLLAATDSVDERHVFAILKTIFANLDFLRNTHPVFEHVSLQGAISEVLPYPLHKGAESYFRSQGIEIPSELLGGREDATGKLGRSANVRELPQNAADLRGCEDSGAMHEQPTL